MTAEENRAAVAAVLEGRRVMVPCSLHASEDATISAACVHRWRTIACDSETDVIECSLCGQQATCDCDFDEEFD